MTNEEKVNFVAQYRTSLSYEEMLAVIKAEAVFQLGKVPTPQTLTIINDIYNRFTSGAAV